VPAPASGYDGAVSDEPPAPAESARRASHDLSPPRALLDFLRTGWDARPAPAPPPMPSAADHAARRARLSARFPGLLLLIPSGVERVRANDSIFRFRPGTDFVHLVGEGEPREVLAMVPRSEGGHDAVLHTEPEVDHDRPEFFTDRARGAFWVGPPRGLVASRARLGLEARPLAELPGLMRAHDRAAVLRGLDPEVDAMAADLAGPDAELGSALSDLRLVKDAGEVAELQGACDLTALAFADVVRALPTARTERDVEVTFFARARREGNDTGYLTIAAAGAHATVLHWSRNDGAVRPQDLLLLDAGVETRRFYTADVTRTLPVSGRFTTAQREVYLLVWEAQQAALAAVRPGAGFREPHQRAMEVLARGLERMGILPEPAQTALQEDRQLYKRYTLHSVSHWLGLDVHDCARARETAWTTEPLVPGMVLTVEPGLYLQADDLTVPERYRGIGVRLEDDVLVTDDGHLVLSAALPTHPDAVEAWMAELWARPGD